jgi:hypothetical protein
VNFSRVYFLTFNFEDIKMATFIKDKNANQLQYVSRLEAFKDAIPSCGRKFAVVPDEMTFEVNSVVEANSDLNIYFGNNLRKHEASQNMSLIYKVAGNVDFPIQNGVFIEKFMFSEATTGDYESDEGECHCSASNGSCEEIIGVHQLNVWLKNVLQEIAIKKIYSLHDEKLDGSTPITFILPTGDVLIMKLFKYGYEPRSNAFDDNAPKFISE